MSLAPNLLRRQAMIHAVWSKLVIFSIGDAEHQKEASDHNPDSRGIWHALDIMTQTDTANDGAAAIILAWLLSDVTDLQYVIHDDRIYGRNQKNGWKGEPYDPTNENRDRHTDHIHVSGKHGLTGKNTATGTGYDTTAEAYTPGVTLAEFREALMPLTAADVKLIWSFKAPDGETAIGKLQDIYVRTGTATNVELPAMLKLLDALTPEALAAALAPLLPDSTGDGTGLTEAELLADLGKLHLSLTPE